MALFGGFPKHWEETAGPTNNSLERLCIFSGLETPRSPQRTLEVVSGVEGGLGLSLFGGFPDTSHWEEKAGPTQNLLERLCMFSGSGTP